MERLSFFSAGEEAGRTFPPSRATPDSKGPTAAPAGGDTNPRARDSGRRRNGSIRSGSADNVSGSWVLQGS